MQPKLKIQHSHAGQGGDRTRQLIFNSAPRKALVKDEIFFSFSYKRSQMLMKKGDMQNAQKTDNGLENINVL